MGMPFNLSGWEMLLICGVGLVMVIVPVVVVVVVMMRKSGGGKG